MTDFSKMTKAQLAALVAELAAKQGGKGARPVAFRPNDSGTLGLYGLRRGPISLYAWEWLFIAQNVESLNKALAKHEKALKWDDNISWVTAAGLKKPSES